MKEAKVPGLDLPDDKYGLLGFNPGHHQKSAGAWAWNLVVLADDDIGYRLTRIGSSDPASSLKRESKLEWYVSGMTHDIQVCIEPPIVLSIT